MKKLFISQPMRDKTDEEILTERAYAVEIVEKELGEKVEVIDSFFQGAPHDATPMWYLGESIKLLGTADVVYFCKDWEKYRGCRIEYACAVAYDKNVMVDGNWEVVLYLVDSDRRKED